MLRFQQILQYAIQENVTCVELSANSAPRGTINAKESVWVDFGNMEAPYIELLFQKLFPAGVTDRPERGQIDVPRYGKLLTIAVPNPIPRLLVFMPHGHPAFQQTWDEIINSVNIDTQDSALSDNPFEPGLHDVATPPAPQPPAVPPPPPATMAPPPPPGPALNVAATPPMEKRQPIALSTDAIPQPTPHAEEISSANISAQNHGQPDSIDSAPSSVTNEHAESGNWVSNGDMSGSEDMFIPPQAATPPPQENGDTSDGVDPDAFEPPPDMFVNSIIKDMSHLTSKAPKLPLSSNPVSTSAAADSPTPPTAPAPASTTHRQTNAAVDNVIQPLAYESSDSQPHDHAGTPPAMAVTKRKMTIEPGPKEVDKLLLFMLEKGASDLHVTSGEPIALRIDGEVQRFSEWQIDEQMFYQLFNPITSEHNQYEFSSTNDTDFAYEIPEKARFRVNLFRDRLGPCAVLRQIPSRVLSFKDLNLPEQLRKFCYLKKGLVVVTGPTGSGKSTTLAALVDHMNDVRKDHILTLEDPIEFVHAQKNCLIRQREVHKHTSSFARALKAALREDPDIILVGELRDLETTALAIEIAETGHLVMGTLHTSTAVSTIDRIIDQYAADQQEQIRTMLAESLKGVIAQTLMRKVGGGRCAAHEILVVDSAVSALIREGKTHMIPNHMQSQKAAGNILLNDSLTRNVLSGLVDSQEAWRHSIQKTELLNRFRTSGIDLGWYEQIQDSDKENQKAS